MTLQEKKILEEGLAKHIDQSNKGFQLLSKMGFKCAFLTRNAAKHLT